MKTVAINLVLKANTLEKVYLGIIALAAAVTLGITVFTTSDYFSNNAVIQEYENRIQLLNQRAQKQIKKAQQPKVDLQDQKKNKKDMAVLVSAVRDSLFPHIEILSEIEQKKPDKVNINELVFSENLNTVTLKGDSNYIQAITEFLTDMGKSSRLNIELSRVEIKENNVITFELTAKWETT